MNPIPRAFLLSAFLLGGAAVLRAVAPPTNAALDAVVEKCIRILRFGDLHSPYKPTKGEAVVTLGMLGAEQAVPVLIDHLKGEANDQLRVHIVRALGWIRNSSAVPALKEAAFRDRYLYVRKYAAEALKEITGVEHEYDRTGEAEARKRAFDAVEARRNEREERANKAPEPTPTSVTSPAAKKPRQP